MKKQARTKQELLENISEIVHELEKLKNGEQDYLILCIMGGDKK